MKTDTTEDYHTYMDDLNTFLTEVDELGHSQEAYTLLDECEVVEFAEAYEYGFDKPSSSLLQSLYIINEAAKGILEKVGQENDKAS